MTRMVLFDWGIWEEAKSYLNKLETFFVHRSSTIRLIINSVQLENFCSWSSNTKKLPNFRGRKKEFRSKLAALTPWLVSSLSCNQWNAATLVNGINFDHIYIYTWYIHDVARCIFFRPRGKCILTFKGFREDKTSGWWASTKLPVSTVGLVSTHFTGIGSFLEFPIFFCRFSGYATTVSEFPIKTWPDVVHHISARWTTLFWKGWNDRAFRFAGSGKNRWKQHVLKKPQLGCSCSSTHMVFNSSNTLSLMLG